MAILLFIFGFILGIGFSCVLTDIITNRIVTILLALKEEKKDEDDDWWKNDRKQEE